MVSWPVAVVRRSNMRIAYPELAHGSVERVAHNAEYLGSSVGVHNAKVPPLNSGRGRRTILQITRRDVPVLEEREAQSQTRSAQ